MSARPMKPYPAQLNYANGPCVAVKAGGMSCLWAMIPSYHREPFTYMIATHIMATTASYTTSAPVMAGDMGTAERSRTTRRETATTQALTARQNRTAGTDHTRAAIPRGKSAINGDRLRKRP